MASERRLWPAELILALFAGADGTAALGALLSTLDFNLAILWIMSSRFCSKPIKAASRSMASTVMLGISGDYIEKHRHSGGAPPKETGSAAVGKKRLILLG